MALKIYFIKANKVKITTVATTKRDAMSRFIEMGYNVGVPEITIAGKKPQKRPKKWYDKKGQSKKSRPGGNRRTPRLGP